MAASFPDLPHARYAGEEHSDDGDEKTTGMLAEYGSTVDEALENMRQQFVARAKHNIRAKMDQASNDVNERCDGVGSTILHEAVRYRLVDYVRELLDTGGIDVNIRDRHLRTPLFYAVMEYFEGDDGQSEAVLRMLLERDDIEVNLVDDLNGTELQCAVLAGKREAAAVLLSYDKIDVNAKNNSGVTCLHMAACTPQVPYDIFQFLLNVETIDVNAQDNDGDTPLCLARQSSLKKRAEALQSRVDIERELKHGSGRRTICTR